MTELQLTHGWATYLRVSDEDKQHPERSFAFQRRRIEEQLLSDSELPFIREYRDMLTGKSPRRADYRQMLSDAAAGRFSHLGLYRADRFGRDTIEGLQAATKLISLGIKIRVAHMPGMQPETPDGFFMFLLQMGLAQREVDVHNQRRQDGIEAKLRAGGWPFKAPDGYVNKEELISSGKYRRWIEPDPQQSRVWREAWDLLLTDRHTLEEICEELHARGHTRASGKPWVWEDPGTGQRKYAANKLSRGFHRPLYAGWVVSGHFGIVYGEIRGDWEPIISGEEFERGLAILKKHDANKSRSKRHVYLLRDLVWMEADGRRYRMYCSTPTGRSAQYRYYVTHARPAGRKWRLACEVVDRQIPNWLRGIHIEPGLLPYVREVYQTHVAQSSSPRREELLKKLQTRIERLRDEEADLARLLVTGKLSEETYDRLRREWQAKLFKARKELDALRRENDQCLDDLDVALLLLSQVHRLFERLNAKQQSTLLHIMAKRIIVNTQGELIDYELQTPFGYLVGLVNGNGPRSPKGSGSNKFPYPPPDLIRHAPRQYQVRVLLFPL